MIVLGLFMGPRLAQHGTSNTPFPVPNHSLCPFPEIRNPPSTPT